MPPLKLPNLTPARLRAAYQADLAACWQLAQKRHPDHTPYAFVLYGVEGGASLSPQVLTEESLTEVAERYLQTGAADTLEESRKNLRYSVPDSPRFEELADKLTMVDALLEPHASALQVDEISGYELLVNAGVAAFKGLDAAGLFGRGKERERLLLIIITDGTEKDWSKSTAKKLNPPAVFKRFEDHTRVEGEYKASAALVLAPDGRSLYSTGSRNLPGKKNNGSVSEVVAYDVAGPALKRRWEFTFPPLGDSGRAVACAQDGRTILLLRRKYVAGIGQALLMRFAADKNKVIEQAQVTGEPTCLAVSNDDSQAALGLHDKTVHILDQKLAPLAQIQLKSTPYALCWLPSGKLLIGTDAGLWQLDEKYKPVITSHQEPVGSISVDAAGEYVAVASAVFQPSSSSRLVEYGFYILRPPAMELVRKISLPGHQLTRAVISADHRYVAFDAGSLGARRHYTVVAEVETGREIARRKLGWSSSNDLAFTEDNCGLYIAKSTITPKEPIILWSFLKK